MEPLRVRLFLRQPGQSAAPNPDALIVPARIVRKPAVTATAEAGPESGDV